MAVRVIAARCGGWAMSCASAKPDPAISATADTVAQESERKTGKTTEYVRMTKATLNWKMKRHSIILLKL
ncbi:hypothetical protein [Salipiger abyssi]|uniref:hypothetical protein n=1 Tax=Salipiger abyssi TaxID=1250539 RepID=UPI001A8E4AA3|nr:hypothetical protein [Salipiger abyssi]MBN9889881.1 hypothetical protein [Salipiger abyssi]